MTQLTTYDKHIQYACELNVNPSSYNKCVENEMIININKNQKSQSFFNNGFIDTSRFVQVDKNIVDNQHGRKLNLRMARFTFDSISPEKTFHPWLGYSIFLDKAENLMRFSHGNLAEITNRKDELTEKAIQGIIKEGELIEKRWEAEQLTEHLTKVKNMPLDIIQACCVNLYTRDSSLYRILNRAMRSTAEKNQTLVWKNKIATLGPFALLLWSYLVTNNHSKETIYRGVHLTDEMIKEYISIAKENPYRSFQAFTSCTRNRHLAEKLGNTLFVISIEENFLYTDISSISHFPEECETLLPPVGIQIENIEYDLLKNRHIIYVKI